MNNDSPKQTHSNYQATIAGLLGQLEYLARHNADGGQVTWEHVGQLVYLKDKLTDLVVFMEGQE